MHLWNFIASKRTRKVLLFLNATITLAVFFAFRSDPGSDFKSYASLADGILHGNYSMWWFLPVNIPDTFRNPGYPLFLVPFRYFTTNVLPIQLTQLMLYAGAVWFTLRIMRALGGGIRASNIFLLILLPSVNLPYYSTTIFPETPTLFLICAFVWSDVSLPDSWRKGVLLALTAGAAFQLRSTVLLLPLVWIITRFLFTPGRTNLAMAATFIGLFSLTLVPFSLWNYHHHGVFRPTPLEGGGGVVHMGWWSGKLPGHTEKWYWGNRASMEMLEFTNKDSIPRNIDAFNAEWAGIDSQLRPLLTSTDSSMLEAYRTNKRLFKTYNTSYTLLREKLLLEATLGHVQAEPGYTFAYKSYSALRLWITGIQMDRFRQASLRGKLVEAFPFLLTSITFLLAVVLVPWALLKYRGLFVSCLPLLVWLLYFGVIHIPFVIQARYTIPVRLLFFALIAICAERLLSSRTQRKTNAPEVGMPAAHP